MPKPLSCPKCKGTMIEGFIPDFRSNESNSPISWIEGEPEATPSPETKVRDKIQLPIKTFCCRKCGFLEFYAS